MLNPGGRVEVLVRGSNLWRVETGYETVGDIELAVLSWRGLRVIRSVKALQLAL